MQVSVESLTVKSVGEAESAGLWGLDRIDQKALMRDYQYHYSYVGTGVHVYTVDTVSIVDKLCTLSHGWHSQSFICTRLVICALHVCQVGLAPQAKTSGMKSCDSTSCIACFAAGFLDDLGAL